MDNKTCIKCKVTKPIQEFFTRSSGKPDGHCKDCQREYGRNHYKRNKHYYYKRNAARKKQQQLWFIKLLEGKKCSICGESRIECLDFDHRHPDEKVDGVSTLLFKGGRSFDIVKEEAEKCDILCANCHRVRTAKQFNWYKTHGE